jgi:hypothetical protein
MLEREETGSTSGRLRWSSFSFYARRELDWLAKIPHIEKVLKLKSQTSPLKKHQVLLQRLGDPPSYKIFKLWIILTQRGLPRRSFCQLILLI